MQSAPSEGPRDGPFNLTIGLYSPKDAILTGAWQPPLAGDLAIPAFLCHFVLRIQVFKIGRLIELIAASMRSISVVPSGAIRISAPSRPVNKRRDNP